MEKEQLEWIIKHLRYTQALCEIILENMTEADIEDLKKKVRMRVNEIS